MVIKRSYRINKKHQSLYTTDFFIPEVEIKLGRELIEIYPRVAERGMKIKNVCTITSI